MSRWDEALDEDLFRQDEATERRAAVETAREFAARQAAEMAARDAAFLERARTSARDAGRRELLAEYRAAGVEPPSFDDDGMPRVSLALLRTLGWRVEEINRAKILVAPPRPSPRPDGKNSSTGRASKSKDLERERTSPGKNFGEPSILGAG